MRPPCATVALLLALLAVLLPAAAFAGGWTTLKRVTDERSSRLDSLHQLSADRGQLHLVHPRTGPARPTTASSTSAPRTAAPPGATSDALFSATRDLRHVVPNLALAARGDVVAVAWRVHGPRRHTLFVRVSRDGGDSFASPEIVFSTRNKDGIGVPAVAVGGAGRLVTVAWTDRAKGRVRVRTSRDAGRTFGDARTVGRTGLSIDCRERLTDGLVGLVASKRIVHLAWSRGAPRPLPGQQRRGAQLGRSRPHVGAAAHDHAATELRLAGARRAGAGP